MPFTPLYGAGHCLFLPSIWVWPRLIYLTTKAFPYTKWPATLQFQHTMAGRNHFLTGVGWPCILLPCMGLATALRYIYGSGHPPLIYHISVPFPLYLGK